MNTFVKFARGRHGNVVGVKSGWLGIQDRIEIIYHNGIKPMNTMVECKKLTEITAAEFEQAIRKKGQTAMLQYLAPTTVIEPIVWHTDPNDLPEVNKSCLVIHKHGGVTSGVKSRIIRSGLRHHFGFKAWAYEPKGPQ